MTAHSSESKPPSDQAVTAPGYLDDAGKTMPADESVARGLRQSGVGSSTNRTGESTGGSTGGEPGEDAPVHLDLSDRYEHLGQFARGGMSTIHRARDTRLQRVVAMKVIDQRLGEGEGHRQRFDIEAQITGQLDHPNVVPIYDLGETESGERYITMKLVAGRTLRTALQEAGPVPAVSGRLDDFLSVFIKVCDAVAFAHSRGVIHRDLKPENIVLGDFGEVYVMDWGIARLLSPGAFHEGVRVSKVPHADDPDKSGSPVGTPYYMAPEQALGAVDEIDERTDVFALGAMLYEILTGKPPYEGGSLFAVLYQAMTGAILPPEVRSGGATIPPGLSRITMRAMSKEPDARYATVLALKHEVEMFLRGVARFPTQNFAAGERVVSEGDSAESAYVITRGRCEAYRMIQGEKVVLRVMGPGEVFGETAVFTSRPRTANVEALEDLTVMVVTRESLTEGLGLHTWMGAFVRALADRFTELDQKLTAQSVRSPGTPSQPPPAPSQPPKA